MYMLASYQLFFCLQEEEYCKLGIIDNNYLGTFYLILPVPLHHIQNVGTVIHVGVYKPVAHVPIYI